MIKFVVLGSELQNLIHLFRFLEDPSVVDDTTQMEESHADLETQLGHLQHVLKPNRSWISRQKSRVYDFPGEWKGWWERFSSLVNH